jgi:hypothetical protein
VPRLRGNRRNRGGRRSRWLVHLPYAGLWESVADQVDEGAKVSAPADGRQIGQPFNPWRRFNGVFVPLGLLAFPGLSDGAKLLYGRLGLYAGKDGACYAGRDTMAKDMGVHVATITRLLNELTQAGFIRRIRRGPGRNDACEFLYHAALIESEKLPSDVAEMRDQGAGDDVAELQHQDGGMISQNCTPDVAGMRLDDVALLHPPYKEEKIQDQKIQRKELQADDSRAFRKPREKSPECAGFPSPIPNDGETRNGLTPAAAIASKLPAFEDVQALRSEMGAIRGQLPTQSAMEGVLEALGDASVTGFVQHLQGVHQRYRPGAHRAVGTWKWFVSAAHSFAAAETPGAVDAGCRHGKADGACAQCLPRADFEAGLEAF